MMRRGTLLVFGELGFGVGGFGKRVGIGGLEKLLLMVVFEVIELSGDFGSSVELSTPALFSPQSGVGGRG